MKKLLTLTLCMVMMLASASFATNTRVLTMGDNNEIMLDEANIWLYPSRVFDYPDMAVVDFVGYNDYDFYDTKDAAEYNGDDYFFHEFGVHWKFGEEKPFVLGTYFFNSVGDFGDDAYVGNLILPVGLGRRGFDFMGSIFPSSRWGMVPELDFTMRDYTNRRIALFYARELGGNKFGFSFQYMNSSVKEEDGDPLEEVYNQAFTRYNFGLGLTEAQGKWDVSLLLQMLTWTDKTSLTDTATGESVYTERTKPSGNMTLNLSGRYFWQQSPVITFVPHANFMLGKFESEWYRYANTPDASEINEYKLFSFQGGFGMHYTPTQNMLAVIDFGIAYTTWKWEETDNEGPPTDPTSTYEVNVKIFTLPYFRMGFEGEVFNWLDVRFGATSYWRNFTETDTDNGTDEFKYYEKFPDNMTYLGFAFNFGDLTIDTYTNPQLFLHGFDFISGSGYYEDSNSMNAALSAIYRF